MSCFKLDDIINGDQFTLGLLIHMLNQHKDRLLAKHLHQLDITPQQFKVLLLLYRDRVHVCKTISQDLFIDAGSITRMVDRLEKKDLLHRVRDKQDRRRVQLVLTDQEIKLCKQFPPLIVDTLNEMTQGLSQEEVQQLESLIHKILVNNGALSEHLTMP